MNSSGLLITLLSGIALCAQEPLLHLESPEVLQAGTAISELISVPKTNAAASNGRDFLVAWSENHAAANVMAARISADGVLLDPYGIRVASSNRNRLTPQLAAVGRDYFIVFENSPALPIDGRSQFSSKKLVTLTAEGKLRDVPGTELFSEPDSVRSLDLIGGSDTALMAFNGFNEKGYRIISSTQPPSMDFPLPGTLTQLPILGMGASPEGFLLAWSAGNSTLAARFRSNGELLDPDGIALSYFTPPVVISGNESSYLIVAPRLGRAVRISTDGRVLDPTPVHIELPSLSLNSEYHFAPTADGWEFAGVDNKRLTLVEFSPDLESARFSSTNLLISDVVSKFSVARNNAGTYLISWPAPARISYIVRHPDGSLSPIQNIPLVQNQHRPAITRAASEYGLFWTEETSQTNSVVRLQRLDLHGQKLHEPAIELLDLPVYATNITLGAASAQSTHLLLAAVGSGISGYLVGPDNDLPIFATVQMSQDASIGYRPGLPLRAIVHGDEFLAWWETRASSTNTHAVRISSAGKVLLQGNLGPGFVDLGELNNQIIGAYRNQGGNITLGVLDLRSSTIRFKTNIVLSAGAQPRIVSKDNLALLAWEVRSNNVTSLRATFFSELPATGLSSTELIRFRYPAQYSLAASEHGFLIYGREEKPLDYGNLPDGRTFAFYIERTRGSVLSNVVENASGFASSISIEGGTSDFFVTYISPLHGMQTVTQWIMPTQSSFALTGPKVRQGRFVTGFSALVDRAYQVEVSDDLKDWHVVADLDGVGPYEISTERNTGHRFFRVTAALE